MDYRAKIEKVPSDRTEISSTNVHKHLKPAQHDARVVTIWQQVAAKCGLGFQIIPTGTKVHSAYRGRDGSNHPTIFTIDRGNLGYVISGTAQQIQHYHALLDPKNPKRDVIACKRIATIDQSRAADEKRQGKKFLRSLGIK